MIIFALTACASAGAIDILTVPRDALAWTVVHTSPVTVPVMRPEGTARTVFTATNLAGEETMRREVPAAEDEIVWTPFEGRGPKEDDVHTLALAYFQPGAATPFSNVTARVAVLRGAFDDAIEVTDTAEAAGWGAMGAQVVAIADRGDAASDGPFSVRVAQEGVASDATFSSGTGVFAHRFRFPPWRIDRTCTFTTSRDGTTCVSEPCQFRKTGFSVYAY